MVWIKYNINSEIRNNIDFMMFYKMICEYIKQKEQERKEQEKLQKLKAGRYKIYHLLFIDIYYIYFVCIF